MASHSKSMQLDFSLTYRNKSNHLKLVFDMIPETAAGSNSLAVDLSA